MQPLRTFAAHQRPQGGRATPPGEELVSGGSGLFQLRSPDSQTLSPPSGQYNFVRVQGLTRNQTTTVLSSRAPHAALAGGRPVLYAGTAAIDAGKLQWWSNYSGTYQPLAEFNRQAALPPDKFVPWQKLQMGGMGMQRGMLRDHRQAGAPKVAEKAERKTGEPAKEEAAPHAGAADRSTAATTTDTAKKAPS